jgi:hypothetical protein
MPPEDSAADSVPASGYRRAAVRIRCDGRSARRLFVIESYRTVPAEVANISLTGIGLVLPEPLSTGTYVFVELDGQVTAELFAKAVHATPRGEGWLVGCELVTPLTRAELKLFACRGDE